MGMPGGETGKAHHRPRGWDHRAGGEGLRFHLEALSPADKLWGSDAKGGSLIEGCCLRMW